MLQEPYQYRWSPPQRTSQFIPTLLRSLTVRWIDVIKRFFEIFSRVKKVSDLDRFGKVGCQEVPVISGTVGDGNQSQVRPFVLEGCHLVNDPLL